MNNVFELFSSIFGGNLCALVVNELLRKLNTRFGVKFTRICTDVVD